MIWLSKRFGLRENGDPIRDRLLSMNVNALVGYLLVEISIVTGKATGLLPGTYTDTVILSSIVDTITIIIIGILCSRKFISRRFGRIIFAVEYFIYLGSFASMIFFLGDLRFVGMIFAVVAITIELPFTTFYESISIVFGSFLVYIAVSCYIVLQGGDVPREFLYIVCAVPAILAITYVARQINHQRARIETGKIVLEEINDKLVKINNDLRRSRDMSAHDINFAAHVQNAFLPETPKDLVDWDIAVFFRPTRGVSGDCYDFYQKEKNLKGLSIFDVSGHGLSSGLLTMIVKPSMMRYFNQMSKYALGRILSKVNESIVGEFSVIENYITGIVLRFENGSAEYVNAGHPEVVIKRAGEVKAAPIQEGDDCIKGQPIGITRYYEYRSMKFPISQGDTLLLYTDCLVETSDDDGNRYGLKSLTDSMAAAPDGTADMILDHIMFDFFSGTNPDLIEDDLTVIVAKKR